VVSLWAPDEWEAAHFYRDVVGLKLIPHQGRPYFDLGGTYLTILRGSPRPALDAVPDRFPLVAFTVRSLEGAIERLRSSGVEMPWGIEGAGTTRYVMFRDPAGNIVELAEGLQ
jgi:catechol 2,3-dioxygenase-like lactoylglutathione lyase family enzyme